MRGDVPAGALMAGARSVVERRAGWLLVAASIGLALAAQVAGPAGVPLYDGVVVIEPYRFLHPTGNQVGQPTSFSSSPAVTKESSPVFVAATTESPPQAQLIAQEGAFILAAGTTNLQVSITPVEAPPAPAGAAIAGNAYEITVTNQSGSALQVGTGCPGCLTLIMRATEGTESASIKRFAGGTWQDIETVHAGTVDQYQASPTALGTFAVIGEAAAPTEIDPLILVGGGAVILILIAGVLLFFKVTPATPSAARSERAVPPTASRPNRIPTKRKGGRRPPSGRTDR
jgi:hypothetical protein